MAKPNPTSRHIAEFAETEAIIGLLGHVARRTRKPPPAPPPEPAPEPPMMVVDQAPASAFIVYDAPPAFPSLSLHIEPEVEVPPPLPPPVPAPEPERFETPVPMQSFGQSFSWESALEEEKPPPLPEPAAPEQTLREESPNLVEQPIAALTLGEFFARMNWRNRPDEMQPLPMIGRPDPPRFDDTVESVLSAFAWDDE